MREMRDLIKYTLFGVAFISLAGCTFRPNLVGAYVKKGGDKTDIVEVILSAVDAKTIKDREIYFSVVVVDCKNYENRYPSVPYIAGMRASNFKFPIAEKLVTVEAAIPERIFAELPNACVALQGGSYFFGKIDSAPVPLANR